MYLQHQQFDKKKKNIKFIIIKNNINVIYEVYRSLKGI